MTPTRKNHPLVARKFKLLAMMMLLAAGFSTPLTPGQAKSTAATPITDCSSASSGASVEDDFAAGGNYIFACSGSGSTYFVTISSTVTVSGSLTVAVTPGQSVILFGCCPSPGRFMVVNGGTVKLSNLTISGFSISSGDRPSSGATGPDGTPGTDGATGTALTGDGGNGTDGGNGVAGSNGGASTSAGQGGAMLIKTGASVTLHTVTFTNDNVFGWNGGDGGSGGEGGRGGSGGNDGGDAGNGGNGGKGGKGAEGGRGGAGQSAEGGAIYNAGSLTITGSTFSSDKAEAGSGGFGGNGGDGGFGGEGGIGGDNDQYEAANQMFGNGGDGGDSGSAGNAGAGGNGGNAEGGAIYNAGSLTLQGDTFDSNKVIAGRGGNGANNDDNFFSNGYGASFGGGDGGASGAWCYCHHNGDGPPAKTGGGKGGTAGTAGESGLSGAAGTAGNASGGGLYDAGTVTGSGSNLFEDNSVTAGNGGFGGDGGAGGGGSLGGNTYDPYGNGLVDVFGGPVGDDTAPTAGSDGSSGTNGGDADGGGFASSSRTLLNSSVCDGNTVTAGIGGTPGKGGLGGDGASGSGQSQAANGADGAAGVSGRATNPQPTCGDQITASISFPDDPNGVPSPNLGDTLTVAVTISASQAPGNFTGLVFSGGGPLQMAPAGVFTVVKGPTPPLNGPLTLAPEASATFTYTLKAAKIGLATLTTAISGQDSQNNAVNASDAVPLNVGLNLKVDLSYSPHNIKIPLDDKDNRVPQSFSVTVKVTNPLTKPIQDVNVDKTPITELMGKDIAIPVRLDTSKPQPNRQLGTINAGQTKSITFPFLATADGQARVTWLATATNPDDSKQTLKGAGSTVVTADPTVVLTLTLNGGGSKLIKSGDFATVGGVITNITNAQVVELAPITTTETGNAGAGNPIDPDNPPPTNAYPLPMMATLTPAQVKAFSADVQTVVNQGTRGSVNYQLPGCSRVADKIVCSMVDRPDGSQSKLTAAQVRAEPSDGTLTFHIDDSAPQPDPADFKTEAANFSHGFLNGAGQWFGSTFTTVAWLLENTPRVILKVELAPIEMMQAIDYYVAYWAFLTPDARQEWLNQVSAGIAAQPNSLGKSFTEVKAKVDLQVTQWLDGLTNAWYTGDWNKVADFTGEVAGNVALEAASWSIKLPEAAKLVRLGEAVKEAQVVKRVAEGLRALKAGDDLVEAGTALSKLFGLTSSQVEALQLLAREKGLLIAVRARNPLSIKWERLGALVKPEAIKIKTVDEIDTLFLDYSKLDEGSVIFKQPITTQQLRSSSAFQAASPEVQTAAESRLAMREKEWTTYQEPYAQMAKPLDQGGGVDVAYDYAANGAAVPAETSVATARRFKLVPLRNAATRGDYYAVEIADQSGKLRRVTGDVDIEAITRADGGTLSPQERLDTYLNLQDTLGMQHGDTLSWLQDGELLSKSKGQLLSQHAPGGEPLAVFDPGGAVRANYIEPKYTFFNAADKQGRIWYVGGYRTPQTTAYHFGQLAYPMFYKGVTNSSPFLTPAGWVRLIQQPAQKQTSGGSRRLRVERPAAGVPTSSPPAPLAGRCKWEFSSAPTAGVVYPDGKGGLKRWSASKGWTPLDITSCWYATTPATGSPLGSNHILSVKPETSVQTDVKAGVSTVTVNGIRAVDSALSPATSPWLKPKEIVVFDPGTPNQELGTIKSLAGIGQTETVTLAAPLKKGHLAGTMVAVTSGPNPGT